MQLVDRIVLRSLSVRRIALSFSLLHLGSIPGDAVVPIGCGMRYAPLRHAAIFAMIKLGPIPGDEHAVKDRSMVAECFTHRRAASST